MFHPLAEEIIGPGFLNGSAVRNVDFDKNTMCFHPSAEEITGIGTGFLNGSAVSNVDSDKGHTYHEARIDTG